MRSYWVRVGPKFNDWYPYKKGHRHREKEESHKRTEAKIGMIQLQPIKKSRILGIHQKLGRGKEGVLQRTFRKTMALPTS